MAATREQIINTFSRGTAMNSEQSVFVTDGILGLADTPTFTITGSGAFVADTWKDLYSIPMQEGEYYAVAIINSVFIRGAALSPLVSQFRYWSVVTRREGLGAFSTIGSVGAQGNTSGNLRTFASGNDIIFQAQFVVSDNFEYRVPVYLDGGIY